MTILASFVDSLRRLRGFNSRLIQAALKHGVDKATFVSRIRTVAYSASVSKDNDATLANGKEDLPLATPNLLTDHHQNLQRSTDIL